MSVSNRLYENSGAPGVTDDGSKSYRAGDRWRDTATDNLYALVDATPGAAVWTLTGDSGLSAAELDFLDGAIAGTQVASKVVVADANVNIGVSKVTQLHIGTSGSETQVTATAAELNYNDLTTLGTAEASKANVLDANSELNSVGVIKSVDKIVSSAEVLALNATPITVLPAVGAGLYAEFLGACVLLDYNATAYTIGAGSNLVFQNLSGGDEVSHSADGTLFDGTADALVWVGPKGVEAGATQTLVANGGIEVTVQMAEWTLGDSPLKIRLIYRVIRKASLEAIA